MRSLFASITVSASMLVAAPATAQNASAAPVPAPAAPAAAGPAPAVAAPVAATPVPYPYPYGAPYAPGHAYSPYGYWAPVLPPVRTERRSEGMRIAGITLFAVGGVASVIGAGLAIKSATTPCPVPFVAGRTLEAHRPRLQSSSALGERIGTAQQALEFCGESPIPGFALLIGGLTGSLLGIPFLVVGNERVPVRPEVSVGAGSADLRVRF